MIPIRNETTGKGCINLDRRRALKLIAFCGLTVFPLPRSIYADTHKFQQPGKSLSLYHPDTHEALDIVFWSHGNYISSALTDINYFLRDRRNNEVQPIDPRLLDLLSSIGNRFKDNEPFHVLSGYRSPQTNKMLRKFGKRASKTSYHLQGKAADVRIPGCRLSSLHRTAVRFRCGGVGYYPRFGFIHLDVGPIRYWQG